MDGSSSGSSVEVSRNLNETLPGVQIVMPGKKKNSRSICNGYFFKYSLWFGCASWSSCALKFFHWHPSHCASCNPYLIQSKSRSDTSGNFDTYGKHNQVIGKRKEIRHGEDARWISQRREEITPTQRCFWPLVSPSVSSPSQPSLHERTTSPKGSPLFDHAEVLLR